MSKNAETYKFIIESEDDNYDNFSAEALAGFCKIKDATLRQYARRIVGAYDVIDLIAEYIGIVDKDVPLYEIYPDGSTLLLTEIKKHTNNGGDKIKLKKRVAELEKENAILRSLIIK